MDRAIMAMVGIGLAAGCNAPGAIPSVAVYSCEPASLDASGAMICKAPTINPGGADSAVNNDVYPAGCTVTLPTNNPYTGGPLVCTCQTISTADPDAGPDAGFEFVCPSH